MTDYIDQELDKLKAEYAEKKAVAVREREELERIRSIFSAQCDKVSSLEANVSCLKDAIADKLIEREGLKP